MNGNKNQKKMNRPGVPGTSRLAEYASTWEPVALPGR